jgi:preprotein translocase subunit YajC
MARGDWKPPPQKKSEPRTARLKRAEHVLRGDEIRLSTKGIVATVTDVSTDDLGRRVIATDRLGERTLWPDAQVIVLDPKPASKADQRRPR